MLLLSREFSLDLCTPEIMYRLSCVWVCGVCYEYAPTHVFTYYFSVASLKRPRTPIGIKYLTSFNYLSLTDLGGRKLFYLSLLYQACFRGEEMAAQRGQGTGSGSPSWWMEVSASPDVLPSSPFRTFRRVLQIRSHLKQCSRHIRHIASKNSWNLLKFSGN